MKTTLETKTKNFITGLTRSSQSTLFRSILISLVLLLFPVLLLVFVDKARQLILGEITEDPVISTFFVYAISLLNLYIFSQRHRSAGNIVHSTGSITKILIVLILIGPLSGWVWTLFVFTKELFPFVSYLLSILFFIDLTVNIRSLLIEKDYIQSGMERRSDQYFYQLFTLLRLNRIFNLNIEKIKSDLKIPSSDFRYYRLKRIVFWTIFVSLVYNIINYEWLDFSDHVKDYGAVGFIDSWPMFFQLLAICYILFAYRYWFFLNYFLVQENGRRLIKILANILCLLLTIAAIVALMRVGTFQPFDIILIFTLTLRYVFILWPLAIGHIKSKWRLVKDSGFLKKVFSLHVPSIKLILSFIFLLLVIIFLADWLLWNHDERQIYEFQTKNVETTPRDSLSTAIYKWVKNNKDAIHKKDTLSPIILVLGQGGGSRAGASMFNALNRIDSISKDNIIALVTISGSSNGAGYFLNTKVNGQKPMNITHATDTLYNHDYITPSLFKMLFTDFLFSEFPRLKLFPKRKNRNEELMDAEVSMSKKIADTACTSVLEKSWSDVYKNNTQKSKLPLFFPVSYNVSRGSKAVSSPYAFNIHVNSPGSYYSLYDTLYKQKKELTLGQSIALSEMFPMISASATIKTSPCVYENFMDGGVYDNTAYEVAHDIYNAVAAARDSLDPKRPIIIISVQNGEISHPEYGFKTDLNATMAAASNSIFKTNLIAHSEVFINGLNKKDKFLTLNSFQKSSPLPPCCKEESGDTTVVMSRFLTRKELSKINANLEKGMEPIKKVLGIQEDSKTEINTTKTILTINAKDLYSLEVPVKKGVSYVFSVDSGDDWNDSFITTNADGFNNILLLESMKRVKGVNCFKLCATYHKNDKEAFAIGTRKEWIAPKDGKISFFANDAKSFYWNNKGNINLTITNK